MVVCVWGDLEIPMEVPAGITVAQRSVSEGYQEELGGEYEQPGDPEESSKLSPLLTQVN